MKYILTGGGTGGHIYPALSIAEEIQMQDPHAEILYVGTENSLESKIVPQAGYSFETIRVKGMPRRLNLASLKSLIALFQGLKDAKKILKSYRPDFVIGTGGYVSGPLVYQAARAGIKTAIQEQNAFPGITNKLLAKRVDRIYLAFAEANQIFKRENKSVLVGNPIRSDFIPKDKAQAKASLKFDKDRPLIVATGGSGGQRSINEAVLQNLKQWESLGYNVLLITGNRFIEEVAKYIKEKNISSSPYIQILAYTHHMAEVFAAADVIIASSSAITMAEIAAMGIPAILVPKSYTAEDHQVYNASAYESMGAAIMIKEQDLSKEKINDILSKILGNDDIYDDMQRAMVSLGKVHAARDIVSDLLAL